MKYEVQVHTPDSFKCKDEDTHTLYEEARGTGVTYKRALELDEAMRKMTSGLRIPKDIETF